MIVTVGFLAHAGARVPGGPRAPLPEYDYADNDTPETLRFPIQDNTGEPLIDRRNGGFDLEDPPNIRREVEYDPKPAAIIFPKK